MGKKLKAIRKILDVCGEGDAYYNLLGAALDLKREQKCDEICINTIDRVLSQLALVQNIVARKP